MYCEIPTDLYIWGYFSLGLFLFWLFHLVLYSIFKIIKASYEVIDYNIKECIKDYRKELYHDLRF